MPYLSLPNFNYDSGPRRIQSGPDHEGYVVLYSGVQSTGPDEGIVVAGAPLSGTLALGAWDYDANWRYVPSTLPSQSGVLNPTPYNVSGALDTYDATRISTRNTVAGAQIASAIGPQPGSTINRPEKYMYFGGAAPDNQNYSPYNTPEINLAAEGKTGGGVTHRTFESSLLTNVLGSQGTSDRSQWRYHQPVYCKTYTETRRSEVPGLMSTPLRAVYRGGSTSYNYNYGGELLANRGGFELLPPDDQTFGCPFPVGCPTTDGLISFPVPGDILTASVFCDYIYIKWYNSDSLEVIGQGANYMIQSTDIDTRIYYTVTYLNGSIDSSLVSCLGLVGISLAYNFFQLYSSKWYATSEPYNPFAFKPSFDLDGSVYVDSWWEGGGGVIPLANPYIPVMTRLSKNRNIEWTYSYLINDGLYQYIYDVQSHCSVGNSIYSFFFRRESDTTSQYVRLYNLIVSKSTGAIQAIKGIRYYSSSFDFPYGTENNSVLQVETDNSGRFWLLCDVQESFVSSSLLIRSVSTIICLNTESNGELKTVWTWEILQNLTNAGAYRDAVSTYIRLNKDANEITINSQSTRTPPVILDATTGVVLYKGGFFTESSAPSAVLSVHEVLKDSENNLYEGQTRNSPLNYVNLFNYPTSSIWLSKKNTAGTIVWMNNYTQAIYSNSSTALTYYIPNGSFLLLQNILLVLIIQFASSPLTNRVRILMLDPADGSIQRYVEIRPPSNFSTFGTDIKLIQANKPNEFNIVCSAGYHITLDVNNIPVNTNIGTVVPSGASSFYSFTDITPSGIATYGSVLPTGIPFPPERVWSVSETPFTVPTASGVLTTPASVTINNNITYR